MEAVQENSDEERKEALTLLKEKMETLQIPEVRDIEKILDNDFVQAWLLHDKMRELPPDIEPKVVSRRKETRLYGHLTFLLEQLGKTESERGINERNQKITSEANRANLLSEKDRSAYDIVFRQLEKLQPAVCLSGHTHAWSLDFGKQHYVAKQFCTERMARKTEDAVDRSLKRDSFLNYGICEISKERSDRQVKVTYKEVEFPCQ